MIIPWQDISPDALDNLIESFVLREGTDYGEHERSLEQKVADVKRQLQSGEAARGPPPPASRFVKFSRS